MGEIESKIGELLKLERQRQKRDLEQLSEELKISVENLESLESGAKDQLPADLYWSLFAKAYSEALGIDYAATVDAINHEISEREQQEKLERDKKRAAEAATGESSDVEVSRGKRGLWLFVGGVIVVAAILTVTFVFILNDESPDSARALQDPAAVARASREAAFADYESGTVPTSAPAPISLWLRATRESWATVVADGDTVLFRSLRPWREYTVEADYRLVISLAHPRYVEARLNETATDLRDPASGRVSQVEVNQVNLQSFIEREAMERPPAQPASPPVQQQDEQLSEQPRQQPTTNPQTTDDEQSEQNQIDSAEEAGEVVTPGGGDE